MKKRVLGKTGFKVTELGLGTWQVGGVWGEPFSHDNAERILRHAIDKGINFIDTADVYGNGESEKAVGKVVKSYSEKIYVASKCGRKLNPHVDELYTAKALRNFVEDSLKNTGLDCIDLIQLHCPPNETYYRPEVFELFDRLKEEGKIQFLGVSVEKVEQALKAIEYPNVCTVQIIFNMFRHRPLELFFDQAKKRNIGVIARVPLASGLLSGKFSKTTAFKPGDHRHDNVNGEQFDKGETFSGVPYHTGLQAVAELEKYFGNLQLAHVSLKWILQFSAISTVIPGASKSAHIESNFLSTELDELTKADMDFVSRVYEKYIKSDVHHLW